jgi:hypothetical protein
MINVRRREATDLPLCVADLKRVYETFAYPAQWPQDATSWIANSTERKAWVAIDDGVLVGHIDVRSAVKEFRLIL